MQDEGNEIWGCAVLTQLNSWEVKCKYAFVMNSQSQDLQATYANSQKQLMFWEARISLFDYRNTCSRSPRK